MAAAVPAIAAATGIIGAGTAVYSAVQQRKATKKAQSSLNAPKEQDIQEVRKSSELPEAPNQESMMARLDAQKKKRRAAAGRQGTNVTGGTTLGGAPSTFSKTTLG
jgi:uncharacterized protein HemX